MKKLWLAAALLMLLSACADAGAPVSEPSGPSPMAAVPSMAQASLVPSPRPSPSPEPVSPSPGPVSPSPEPEPAYTPELGLILSSEGIIDGVIADVYGAKGVQIKKKIPTRSLPLKITNIPEETAGFALVMKDLDTSPEKLHWTAFFTDEELPANASIDNASRMLQGKNSFNTRAYGGPAPQDKTHTYRITVYALRTMPDISNGFALSRLEKILKNNTLAEGSLTGTYSP